MTRNTAGDETMGEEGIPRSVVNMSATGMEKHVYPAYETQVPRTTRRNRAPAPSFPERGQVVYEKAIAPSEAGKVGPTRFEEGLANDLRFPTGFVGGIEDGYATAPGQPNGNLYAKKYADGRGAAGRTNPPPTWDQVRGNEIAAFAQGHGDPSWLVEQTSEQAPLRLGTDLSKVDLSERGRVVHDRAIASNDDRLRPNAATGFRAGEAR